MSYYTKFDSKSSVQHALRKLCKDGDLINIARGFYVKPKIVSSLPGVELSCSTESLAESWAKDRGYILTSTDTEEQYRLRFCTQAPMKIIYWSDGPYRTFQIGYSAIEIRHVADSKLIWHNQQIGRIFRALLTLRPDYCFETPLKKALFMLCHTESEVDNAILRLLSVKLLKNWKPILSKLLK